MPTLAHQAQPKNRLRLTGAPLARSHRGAVLTISLIFLVLLTLLALTSIQSSTLEERMAGHTYDRQIAFQAAEAAIRAAERWLESGAPSLDEGCAGGACTNPRKQIVADWHRNPEQAVWNNARESDVDLPNVRSRAKYIVEDMCESTPSGGIPDSQRVFRITAVGTGGSDAAQVILQTAYVTANLYGAAGACNCGDPSYCDGSCTQITCTP